MNEMQNAVTYESDRENTSTAVMVGMVKGELETGFDVLGEKFLLGTFAVERMSGTVDLLPLTVSERLVYDVPPLTDRKVKITGQIRTYNRTIEGKGRLLVTLFAQSIEDAEGQEDSNSVSMVGTVCKQPVYRTTPFGREIADLMLAVNRAHGKSDYVPSIAWGRCARFAGKLKVGDRVHMDGRLQSREYQKKLENGEVVMRTAYEVSATTLSKEGNDNAVERNPD